MKKNRTVGKTVVMDAARARGLLVQRVKTAEGPRWEVSNGKGLRAFYGSLAEVWSVVRPAPLRVAEAALARLPEEEPSHVAGPVLPSPPTPLPEVEGSEEEEGA